MVGVEVEDHLGLGQQEEADQGAGQVDQVDRVVQENHHRHQADHQDLVQEQVALEAGQVRVVVVDLDLELEAQRLVLVLQRVLVLVVN